MPMYKVQYSSMTARYGPSYIEAESEYEAKRKFGCEGYEFLCTSAREVSADEIRRTLARKESQDAE